MPLTPHQLGTEAPTDKLLERLPMRRDASLISRVMWRNILIQATFQLALLLAILRDEAIFGVELGSIEHFTLIFNVFVFCQVTGRIFGDQFLGLRRDPSRQ